MNRQDKIGPGRVELWVTTTRKNETLRTTTIGRIHQEKRIMCLSLRWLATFLTLQHFRGSVVHSLSMFIS